MTKRIAVVAGGDSSEKVISIKTAGVVCDHLNKSGKYLAVLVNLDRNKWEAHWEGSLYPIDKNNFGFEDGASKQIAFEAAFIAIHGTPGEDGKLQAYFDLIGLPYTGSDMLNSALTFNKWHCNAVLRQLGYKCAESFLLREDQFSEKDLVKLLADIDFPCFVKPNNSGSSFGVTKVKSEDQLKPALLHAFEFSTEVMVEKMMVGREVTCGMMTYKNEIVAFPLTEIISKSEFFDFKAKYEGNSEEITPAGLSEEMTSKVQETAKNLYRDLGLRGLARVDFMLQKDGIYIIEVNTVPGLSAESLVPQQARAAGYTLTELFSSALDECLERKMKEKAKK